MSLRLTLRQAPDLRLDLGGLRPGGLTALSVGQIERLPLAQGRLVVPLAEFFSVQKQADDDLHLVLAGDLSRCDRVGAGLEQGQITVEGGVGDHAGAGLSGGTLAVQGDAGLLAGCEMSGGVIEIGGRVGDFAAGPLPGSMEGMRGGLLRVHGHAGARLADRMRRGTVLVDGDAGDFAASRLVAGTVAIGGQVGAHLAYGMRRGSVLLAGQVAPPPAPGFVPAQDVVPVFWQLLARDLARHGGPFADLPRRQVRRQRGDLAVDGRGELIYLC